MNIGGVPQFQPDCGPDWGQPDEVATRWGQMGAGRSEKSSNQIGTEGVGQMGQMGGTRQEWKPSGLAEDGVN